MLVEIFGVTNVMWAVSVCWSHSGRGGTLLAVWGDQRACWHLGSGAAWRTFPPRILPCSPVVCLTAPLGVGGAYRNKSERCTRMSLLSNTAPLLLFSLDSQMIRAWVIYCYRNSWKHTIILPSAGIVWLFYSSWQVPIWTPSLTSVTLWSVFESHLQHPCSLDTSVSPWSLALRFWGFWLDDTLRCT